MRTLILMLLCVQAVMAEQHYWYPVGKNSLGQTLYQDSVQKDDGLYYPTTDVNKYVLTPNQVNPDAMALVQANMLVQNQLAYDREKQNDLFNEELMINRVLDRQAMLH